ncbi:tRNA (adenosine(37)-N6)-dimethylallyltransferase MiaA [Bengtsoniella intestinalis]|uniref:tRNA (adenosine(37)-N6)-dimethylallyltransferase MiaA n=1 Tax=Bengtsoniella intestinalis TaxID=3073143 RepID=UPI00391FA6D6
MQPLICVVGPTACGKTALGIAIAKAYNGEVVSVDSMQIYRTMTIGTAAVTPEEMDGVPHHMVAIADPEDAYSAARFVAEADACIQDILGRGKRPILVGGTGLYLDALVKGHGFAKGDATSQSRLQLQQRLAQEGIASLYARLQQIDPEAAARLHLNDEKRILRALEVYLETGQTISAHNAHTQTLPPKYEAVYIGLQFADRQDMKDLIDLRVDKMVEAGLLAEVQRLMASGLPHTATAFQAIGYKEFLGVETGELPLEEAIAVLKARSRQYAKRQLTWLRKQPDIQWIYWEKKRDFAMALRRSTEILTSLGVC